MSDFEFSSPSARSLARKLSAKLRTKERLVSAFAEAFVVWQKQQKLYADLYQKMLDSGWDSAELLAAGFTPVPGSVSEPEPSPAGEDSGHDSVTGFTTTSAGFSASGSGF